MVSRINKKAKLAFAGNKTPSLGVFYSVPTKGSKRGHLLTIKDTINGERVDLTFNQIAVLEKVICKARKLASNAR
jgi:hypothetical protein